MKWEAHITGRLAVALLAMTIMLPSLGWSQKNAPRAAPARPAPMPQQHMSRPQVGAPPQQRGHAGDWLRRYKDLPPEEQEKALQNDPNFRRLTPQQQQHRLQQLREFSELPPEQQLRMLNRMETWEHLTPEQKQQAHQIFGQMRELPPDRRRMVRTAVRNLAAMPPDQREQIINSERFKGMFSDQEREIMREVTRLPLAPAEGAEESSPQQ